MKYKNISSLLHNFGHSFTSDTNLVANGKELSFLALLLAQGMQKANLSSVTLTLNPIALQPKKVLAPDLEQAVITSLTRQQVAFQEMARSMGIDPTALHDVTLELKPRLPPVNSRLLACEVRCIDDRGIKHRVEVVAA